MRSSDSRAARSCVNSRARSSARLISDPSAVRSLRSSAPKNGAKVLVRTTSVPNGNSSRLTSPVDASSTEPCSAIRDPSTASSAMPRAPTMRAIDGNTRSATSCSFVADINSPIASCICRCSGRRQRSRSPLGGAKPSMNATALNVARSPVTSASTESVVAARRGEHERGGDRSRSDREHLHPPARDGCLRTARAPQAHRHDQQQHRPVDDEDDDVRGEPPRPRVVRPRQMRQGKGCGDQSVGERVDERGERALRRLERHREAIEEIREEHQEREVQRAGAPSRRSPAARPAATGRRR